MAQQTAVDWLVQQLKTIYDIDIERLSVTDKSKQMEEEQHHNTWLDSRIENSDGYGYLGKEKTFDQYYNETYGKQ
jgi:hypothetical protein